MIKDDPQSQAYKKALEITINGDTIVLEIGARSEFLAMLVAKTGTNKVRMPVMVYQMNVTTLINDLFYAKIRSSC
tara:strand:+ start:893 stop:1117 length:225 start_codon:yes stop_codon:yes gene_type:complete